MGVMIVTLLMGSNEVWTSQVWLGAALLLLNSFVSLWPKLEKSERLIGKRRDRDRQIPLIERSAGCRYFHRFPMSRYVFR